MLGGAPPSLPAPRRGRGGGEGPAPQQAALGAGAVLPAAAGACGFLVVAAALREQEGATHQSPLLKAVLFAFIEEICFRAPQVDNLGAAISLENRTKGSG